MVCLLPALESGVGFRLTGGDITFFPPKFSKPRGFRTRPFGGPVGVVVIYIIANLHFLGQSLKGQTVKKSNIKFGTCWELVENRSD